MRRAVRQDILHFRARVLATLARLALTPGESLAWQDWFLPKAQLTGLVYQLMGKPERARASYDSARVLMEKEVKERPDDHRIRSSLGIVYAGLLLELPGRLVEARQLAEEALAINKTLDPGAAEIWKTYGILALIAEQEAEGTSDDCIEAELQAQARKNRRLARDAKRNFAGTRHELRKYAELLVAAIAACAGNVEAHGAVSKYQKAMRESGKDLARIADALDRVLAGERDADVLCEGLPLEGSMIIETILQGLSDPSTLEDLLPDQEQK